MKEAATHTTTSPAKSKPFFGKNHQDHFFTGGEKHDTTDDFFTRTGAQPKLAMGQLNDVYEQQADAAADKVVKSLSAPAPAPPAQTKPQENKDEKLEKGLQNQVQKSTAFESDEDPGDKKRVQRKGKKEDPLMLKPTGEGASTVPSSVKSSLSSGKSNGAPLPKQTRDNMESAFGADFSGVRIHNGNEAARMNNDLGAQAFTHGNNIYFNEGKYDPSSLKGETTCLRMN